MSESLNCACMTGCAGVCVNYSQIVEILWLECVFHLHCVLRNMLERLDLFIWQRIMHFCGKDGIYGKFEISAISLKCVQLL